MKLNTLKRPLHEFVKAEIKSVIVDIEGTTTPITFVADILFPYIKENVESYLTKNWDEKEVRDDVEALKALAESDKSDGTKDVPEILPHCENGALESVVKNVLWQMSHDRKSTALKQLQGHMWRSAYADGTIKGTVYDDVPVVLRSLENAGKKIYVYSSGSVNAQKLLFKHSNKGDLCPLFSDYFDTNVGGKKEAKSYTKISQLIDEKPDKILFLTDVLAEAEAASKAGVNVCILLRPGNVPIPKDDLEQFSTIKSFSELVSNDDVTPAKRQKTTEPAVGDEKTS